MYREPSWNTVVSTGRLWSVNSRASATNRSGSDNSVPTNTTLGLNPKVTAQFIKHIKYLQPSFAQPHNTGWNFPQPKNYKKNLENHFAAQLQTQAVSYFLLSQQANRNTESWGKQTLSARRERDTEGLVACMGTTTIIPINRNNNIVVHQTPIFLPHPIYHCYYCPNLIIPIHL